MCAKNILRKKAVGVVLSLDQGSPDVLLKQYIPLWDGSWDRVAPEGITAGHNQPIYSVKTFPELAPSNPSRECH